MPTKHITHHNGTGIGYTKSVGPAGSFTTNGTVIMGKDGKPRIANSDIAKGSSVDLSGDEFNNPLDWVIVSSDFISLIGGGTASQRLASNGKLRWYQDDGKIYDKALNSNIWILDASSGGNTESYIGFGTGSERVASVNKHLFFQDDQTIWKRPFGSNIWIQD